MTTSTPAAPPVPPAATPAARAGYYQSHQGDLPARLRDALPTERRRELEQRSGWGHAAVAVPHTLVYGALLAGMIWFDQPWIWLPLAALQGVVILDFIILLHDVIHGSVFARPRPAASRWLGRLYALPSAIAASQFKRWHLDHHRELGSAQDDPKRAHLSPKRNARWLKALYLTPALFVIYARAAAQELPKYAPELRRTIALERVFNVLFHLGVVATLWVVFDGATALRAWIVPLFVFFPVAFMVNRLGQHYWVDPADPAKWGTRVDGNLLSRLLFLNSNLHLEHHYFPVVPLYRLGRLNRELRPFWERVGHPSRSYPQLLWKWFVENREAHTNWDAPRTPDDQ